MLLCKASQSLDQELRQGAAKTYEAYASVSNAIKDWNDFESLQLLSKADVIGFTTTGAAKNFKLLRMLDPKAMIIEEAGQVLESHVLASLTPNLERLILIGDHQQLKPSVSTYELAKVYKLDVSLFERLINNSFEFVQLKEQHRMRPEIAQIVRLFYPDLEDHVDVRRYPSIKGLEKNVFFLDHMESEQALEESSSKTNRFEAEFLLKLAKYLVDQGGYKPSQITILAAYLGQMMLIQRLLTTNEDAAAFNVTVVDNYQGEENDIILLSLVRSNEQGAIGYLSAQSRICVALSRAKMGLYVVGNMADLGKRSKTWRSIIEHLTQNGHIGPQLSLMCQFHVDDSKVRVQRPQDFDNLQPLCSQICGERLKQCGHICEHPCHIIDRGHYGLYKCKRPCERSCSLGHPCSKAQ